MDELIVGGGGYGIDVDHTKDHRFDMGELKARCSRNPDEGPGTQKIQMNYHRFEIDHMKSQRDDMDELKTQGLDKDELKFERIDKHKMIK